MSSRNRPSDSLGNLDGSRVLGIDHPTREQRPHLRNYTRVLRLLRNVAKLPRVPSQIVKLMTSPGPPSEPDVNVAPRAIGSVTYFHSRVLTILRRPSASLPQSVSMIVL